MVDLGVNGSATGVGKQPDKQTGVGKQSDKQAVYNDLLTYREAICVPYQKLVSVEEGYDFLVPSCTCIKMYVL